MGEEGGGHQHRGLLLLGGETKVQGLPGLGSVWGGLAQYPQPPGVTRAHVCLPRAKLSAQLSSHGVHRGLRWGGPEGNMKASRGTRWHKAREGNGVCTGESGGLEVMENWGYDSKEEMKETMWSGLWG